MQQASISARPLIERIATYLNTLEHQYAQWRLMLHEKSEQMRASNLAGLAAVQSRELTLTKSLQALHQQRAELLTVASSEGIAGPTLKDVLESLTASANHPLCTQLAKLEAEATDLKRESGMHLVMLRRTAKYFENTINLIATRGRRQATYHNEEFSQTSSGLLIDASV